MKNFQKKSKLIDIFKTGPEKLTYKEIMKMQNSVGFTGQSIRPMFFDYYKNVGRNKYVKFYVFKNTTELPALKIRNTDVSYPLLVHQFSTEQLIDELRRRGFTGKLITKQEIEL
jgi:hypothetical protein